MLDDHGFEVYEENPFPLAYLITFRTFGTRLHGDIRGSFQQQRDKRQRTIRIDPNVPLSQAMAESLKQNPVILNTLQRKLVEAAILEVCEHRNYDLTVSNIRTNHAHVVVSKWIKPEKIMNDLKTYSSRKLRSAGAIDKNLKVWSRGGSTKYLWKPRHVEAAVDYVRHSQGDIPFEIDKH